MIANIAGKVYFVVSGLVMLYPILYYLIMDRGVMVLPTQSERGYESHYRFGKIETVTAGFTLFTGKRTWLNDFFEPMDIFYLGLKQRYDYGILALPAFKSQRERGERGQGAKSFIDN